MPNIVNKMTVRELTAELSDIDGMLLVSMSGLTVAESEELRNTLAAQGVGLRMIRNKLAKRVFAEQGIEVPGDVLAGNIAIAYGTPEDTIHAAKVVTKSPLLKEGKLTVRAGMLEGNMLDESDASALADVPDRDTLRAMMLGAISGPARGLVSVLSGVPSGLARVLSAHADQGDADPGDEAAS